MDAPTRDGNGAHRGRRRPRRHRIVDGHRERVLAIHRGVLPEQDDLAGGRDARPFLSAPPSDDLRDLPVLDLTALDEFLDDGVELVIADTRASDEIARMQMHVSGLDPLRCQRAQRREVLRQSDGSHQFGEFAGRLDAGQTQRRGGGGIRLERAADRTDFEWNADLPDQVLAVHRPSRQ